MRLAKVAIGWLIAACPVCCWPRVSALVRRRWAGFRDA